MMLKCLNCGSWDSLELSVPVLVFRNKTLFSDGTVNRNYKTGVTGHYNLGDGPEDVEPLYKEFFVECKKCGQLHDYVAEERDEHTVPTKIAKLIKIVMEGK